MPSWRTFVTWLILVTIAVFLVVAWVRSATEENGDTEAAAGTIIVLSRPDRLIDPV